MDKVAMVSAEILNPKMPEPRPHRNRVDELRLWHHRANRADRNFMISDPLTASVGGHFSKTPFEELKPIKLCELEVPKVHLGRYLVCKVVGKPISTSSVSILMQDLNDDVEHVIFNNFCYNFDDVDWIAVGTIFVVKEPWLRQSNSKTAFLRIDSPSDVIFVDAADEEFLNKIGATKWHESMSKDGEVWRQRANEFFKNGKYEKALFLYERGIRCDPDLAVLYLNKSLACLKTGAYYDAYESAKIGMEKGGNKEKALYRMGQAVYGMREWQKAANHFCEVLKENPQNLDASKELKRAMVRLTEEKTGKCDFKSISLDSKKSEQVKLDVADYTGPIEIAHIPGKGRGIVASKDIQKGTLLAVSKSLGSGYTKDFLRYSFAIDQNFETRAAAEKLQSIAAVQNLKNNPQKAEEIYDLYAGETVAKEEIPFGVIDVVRLEKICALNCFGTADKKTSLFDAHLFLIPSYFNHSCLANAHKQIIGDIMIIHACTNIKKGEEIFLPYIHPLNDYSARQKMLNGWNFTCKCKLCEIDSKDEFCSKRDQLLKEYCDYFNVNQSDSKKVTEKGEEILKKIRETYTKRKEYKIVLAHMLKLLSQEYMNFDTTKCKKCLEELITLVDDSSQHAIDEMPVIYYILATLYYPNMAKYEEMKQKALEVSFCTDMEHFKMLYNF